MLDVELVGALKLVQDAISFEFLELLINLSPVTVVFLIQDLHEAGYQVRLVVLLPMILLHHLLHLLLFVFHLLYKVWNVNLNS